MGQCLEALAQPQGQGQGQGQGQFQQSAPQASLPYCDVIFFPDTAMPCRHFGTPRGCNRSNCQYMHEGSSLRRMLGYINNCRSTLDICVFSITCNEIATAIKDAKHRGVRVRIITDDEQAKSTGSDIQELKGIVDVRMDNSPFHMHNKYAIIDGALLLNGSFNWTRSAVINNRENVVASADPRVVGQFRSEFEKIWALYGRPRGVGEAVI